MKIFGRKILDCDTEIDLAGVDEIVFQVGNLAVVVSLYCARTDERIEVRTNDGIIKIMPRAANVIEVEAYRHGGARLRRAIEAAEGVL